MKGAGRTLALRRRPRRQAPSSGFSRAAPLRSRRGVKPKGACGRGRGARSAPCGLRPSPCARETRGGVCERACSVDRSASRHELQEPRNRRAKRRRLSQQANPGPRRAAPFLGPSDEPGKCLAAARPSRRGAYRRAARGKSIREGRGGRGVGALLGRGRENRPSFRGIKRILDVSRRFSGVFA